LIIWIFAAWLKAKKDKENKILAGLKHAANRGDF